jgi:uncharacterized RDD family membrane protein YckC
VDASPLHGDANALLDTDVVVETPEHITYRHRIAGPARRLLAYVLDLLICYAALVALAIVVLVAMAGPWMVEQEARSLSNAAGVGIGVFLLVLFAIQWLYFAVLEAWRGTTPGKHVFRCRVVMLSGRPVGFAAAALRNVLRAADALPLTYAAGLVSVVGLVSMTATRHFQRLGDLVAGTIVIVVDRARVREPLVLLPPALPAELVDLTGDVRLDADERVAIEMFLRRRGRLGKAREIELAQMLEPILSERFSAMPNDPSRALAVLYDRAMHSGRVDGPPSSRPPAPWG